MGRGFLTFGRVDFGDFSFLIKGMKLQTRRSAERGHADHGWLKTWHSFSFADYYDPKHMGFRSLRVINQDIIAPGGGFPPHGHRDMEIFSYVLEGTIEHRDSMGNHAQVKPGQIQVMSAGAGVKHSEFNPSATDRLQILQVWIQPDRAGLKPRYAEWTPTLPQLAAPKVLIISNDGREGSAHISQDADVYRVKSTKALTVVHDLAKGRGLWFQLIAGEVTVGDVKLQPGDAVSSEEAGRFEFVSAGPVEALLFDLA
jgi:redox-sensitive bicupin YhaK (pirin superfamily)